jgi:hypothetical protein
MKIVKVPKNEVFTVQFNAGENSKRDGLYFMPFAIFGLG